MRRYMIMILAAALLGGCDRDKPFKEKHAFTPEEIAADTLVPMVFVEGGTFMIGCTEERGDDCDKDINPASVTVDDFYIGKTEVTQKLWNAVMDTNPSHHKIDENDNLPVENVNWDNALEFLRRLKQKTGRMYLFPTEAEWEYAARGGNKSKGYKYSGGNDIDSVAWYGKNSGGKTHPVGSKQPNELGIYDMSGNVAELTRDVGGSGRYRTLYRVYRGGSIWGHTDDKKKYDTERHYHSCMCLYHRERRIFDYDDNPDEGGNPRVGFRLALYPAKPQPVTAAPKSAGIVVDMVSVEGGTIFTGCTEEQGRDCYKLVRIGMMNEESRDVTLDDFSIGRTEVTQGLWKSVMGSNPSKYKCGNNFPVERVNYDDVQQFINKLNEKTGKKYRLPTGDEWEYAARGGNKSLEYRYSGSNNLDDVAWYRGNSRHLIRRRTHPVGTKRPNELGLYDMNGNVWEWTSNDWRPSARGSSWFNHAKHGYDFALLTSNYAVPSNRDHDLGFRLALSTEEPEPETTDINIDMVFVKGGTFTMGCTKEQGADCVKYGGIPAQKVTVGDFYIAKTELSRRQWDDVIGRDPSPSKYKASDNLPVESKMCDLHSTGSVTWFIKKLNKKTGKEYRLPTEAEWEYAARGGKMSRGYMYAGSNNIDDVAWHKGNMGEYGPFNVGTKAPNELGLYDMSGNAEEWTDAGMLRGGCTDYSSWKHLWYVNCLISNRKPDRGWVEYVGSSQGGIRLVLSPKNNVSD